MSLSTTFRSLFTPHAPKGAWRPDIDGLRALAVLAVIAYHYAPSRLPGGFVGVDIFFVISGYLITGILAKAFEQKSFGPVLLDFYERRIRRIFPALILVLAVSLVVGWLVLFAFEYDALGKHTAAGAGFVQNIVLWRETGYFDVDAIQKPLLHLWSLAVEEQFYIFWPLVLWVIVRRHWPVIGTITVIIVSSFALNVWSVESGHASAAFYLPVTRAWELMAGAWLAIGHRQGLGWLSRGAALQSWLGLTLILLGFVLIRPDRGFPGFWALLPVLGTALIINGGTSSFLNRRVFSLRPAVWVGLISYPLYLWHWVLLSLSVVILGDADPVETKVRKLQCLAASFALAWLTWRYFEQPVRRQTGGKTALALGLTVAVLGVGGIGVTLNSGLQDRPASFVSARSAPYLESILARDSRQRSCHTLEDQSAWPDRWFCELGDPSAKTWVAAYGDSHAARMLPALDKFGKEASVRVVFASQSSCLPLLGLVVDAPTNGPACHVLAGKMAELASRQHAAAVVFIESWQGYIMRPDRLRLDPATVTVGGGGGPSVTDVLAHGLETTLSYYESHQIPVILLQDNPHQTGLVPIYRVRFGDESLAQRVNESAVTVAQNRREQAAVNRVLTVVADGHPTARVVNIDTTLCGVTVCPWLDEGAFLYSDDHHLTNAGAMRVYPVLAQAMDAVLAGNERRLAATAAVAAAVGVQTALQ